MTDRLWLSVTLVSYMVLMIGIGFWASRRTHDQRDFFLGGRALGPWVAALSASASSASAWVLLGVSGAAYAIGLRAVWLMPGALLGYVITWFWVGPRLRKLASASGALTLSELLFGEYPPVERNRAMRAAAIIVLVIFVLYVASQFQAAGHTFSTTFGLPSTLSIVTGASIVLAYTLLGGFWAVAVTDSVQAVLMLVVAVVLPGLCLSMVGGIGGLIAGLQASGDTVALSLTGPYAGLPAFGLVLGMLWIGVGYFGQPHIVNRFMAIRDERSVRQGRVVAIGWACLVFTGMLTLGLSARLLFSGGDPEQVLFLASREAFGPVMAGIVIAAVLSAIMSTADSQLLVAASSIARDWNLDESRAHSEMLTTSRIVVTAVTLLACLVALFAPETIYDRVVFAWRAIGSAFGPLVLLRILGFRTAPGFALASLLLGFGLTVLLDWMTALLGWFPASPGYVVEGVLPFAVAFFAGLAGSRR